MKPFKNSIDNLLRQFDEVMVTGSTDDIRNFVENTIQDLAETRLAALDYYEKYCNLSDDLPSIEEKAQMTGYAKANKQRQSAMTQAFEEGKKLGYRFASQEIDAAYKEMEAIKKQSYEEGYMDCYGHLNQHIQ